MRSVIVCATSNESSLALEFYQQALPLRRAVTDRRGEAITLSNIGNVYIALQNFPRRLMRNEQAQNGWLCKISRTGN